LTAEFKAQLAAKEKETKRALAQVELEVTQKVSNEFRALMEKREKEIKT
jgi:hypothetical protein